MFELLVEMPAMFAPLLLKITAGESEVRSRIKFAAVPTAWMSELGEVVPIPTAPVGLMRRRSVIAPAFDLVLKASADERVAAVASVQMLLIVVCA
jgi:hypothetical protein